MNQDLRKGVVWKPSHCDLQSVDLLERNFLFSYVQVQGLTKYKVLSTRSYEENLFSQMHQMTDFDGERFTI